MSGVSRSVVRSVFLYLATPDDVGALHWFERIRANKLPRLEKQSVPPSGCSCLGRFVVTMKGCLIGRCLVKW